MPVSKNLMLLHMSNLFTVVGCCSYSPPGNRQSFVRNIEGRDRITELIMLERIRFTVTRITTIRLSEDMTPFDIFPSPKLYPTLRQSRSNIDRTA
jgi:hypothetical protein